MTKPDEGKIEAVNDDSVPMVQTPLKGEGETYGEISHDLAKKAGDALGAFCDTANVPVVFLVGFDAQVNAGSGNLFAASTFLRRLRARAVGGVGLDDMGDWVLMKLGRFGIDTTFVKPGDVDGWRAAVRPNTRLFFGETVGNPGLDVLDIPAVAQIGRDHGLPLLVDATLTTPWLQRPPGPCPRCCYTPATTIWSTPKAAAALPRLHPDSW